MAITASVEMVLYVLTTQIAILFCLHVTFIYSVFLMSYAQIGGAYRIIECTTDVNNFLLLDLRPPALAIYKCRSLTVYLPSLLRFNITSPIISVST